LIEVRVPKEINDYKEKLFFNLSLRQTVCTVVAIAINVPLYIYGRRYINQDLLSWIVIGNALLIFFAGFFNYNSMYFEEFLVVTLKYNLLYPQIRKYKTTNLYEVLMKREKGGK
jgi:hypothetical protein